MNTERLPRGRYTTDLCTVARTVCHYRAYSSMPDHQPRPSRFAPYKDALAALSQRTRTPLPSLVVSFAIVHEITAFVPLAGFFFTARALGVGDNIANTFLSSISEPQDPADNAQNTSPYSAPGGDGFLSARLRNWAQEGEAWAERVGRRYGMFGFEKHERGAGPSTAAGNDGKLAGDVANAVVAYALTKALLPVRIGLSLYLSPAFSRGVVEPFRLSVLRIFRR
ncbi:hypothetical protein CERSUDRAFT_160755 [Gelatoporia subvermispora B]|uniref:Uncharacterized protein n=1 Tax=Ceriporiopsis subvermispora (strain B) TaxID=914234 RepID=M2Q8K0_CERS8|nr:hypothetical protein CERSUDRAFT_160755 [Gelatoporia subvermispora B]